MRTLTYSCSNCGPQTCTAVPGGLVRNANSQAPLPLNYSLHVNKTLGRLTCTLKFEEPLGGPDSIALWLPGMRNPAEPGGEQSFVVHGHITKKETHGISWAGTVVHSVPRGPGIQEFSSMVLACIHVDTLATS